jgi:hypothetical protein
MDDLIGEVARIMLQANDDFAVRADRYGTIASEVEVLVQQVAKKIHRQVFLFQPTRGSGQASTYHRDNEMVSCVDEVFAFFPEGYIMVGGTAHVVEAALRDGKRVTAYSVAPDGLVMEIGSDEGATVHHG